MDEDRVRSLRDQCQSQGVPFFYKQKVEAGRKVPLPPLDGKVWDQMPDRGEFGPAAPAR
jgi:protein gp37